MTEDRKFYWNTIKNAFVNRVSGEAIPDDEPVIIFRARDKHALRVLYYYQQLCADEHHQRAIVDRINEFGIFARFNSERMKEPGITHDILLNKEPNHD